MAKGRPKQEDRIQELEKELNAMHQALKELYYRVNQIETRAVSKQEAYKPLFDHWPGLR